MADKIGAHQRPENQRSSYDQQRQQQAYEQQRQQQGYEQQRQQQAYEQQRQQQAYQQRQRQQQQQQQQRAAAQRRAQQMQMSRGYRPVTTEASQYSHYNSRYQALGIKPKKKHTARNVIITLLVILLLVGGVAGFTGYTLYSSAKVVKSDASAVMADISDLKDQLLSDDPTQAVPTANDLAKRAKNMKAETSGWAWQVAGVVPVYGQDVNMVKELATTLDDLAQNAVVPLVNEVSQVSLKNLVVDGAINVELAEQVVGALYSASPVIERSAHTIETMGDSHFSQINEPLKKAKEKVGSLEDLTSFAAGIAPTLTQMLGAGGQTRTYLIVAQNNAEIHSTGGFLGSIGPMYITDGKIDLGDFRYIYDIYPSEGTPYAAITDEERAIFGDHVVTTPGNSGWLPNWARVGQIESYYWEAKGYGHVDGVIGIDPVFLQHMLAVVGPVTLSNGVELNGENTARYLLHEVYYLPVDEQDPIFEETAKLAFGQFMAHLGDLKLTDFAKLVKSDIDAKRVVVWMANSDEEAAMSIIGCQGDMNGTGDAPAVGAYINDLSFAKLNWYLKAESSVGEGVRNADGSTTYRVTASLINTMSSEEAQSIPEYMAISEKRGRTRGDMIIWLMLSAPMGGSISNLSLDGYANGDYAEASLEGHDVWYGAFNINPQETATVSFDLTLPAGETQAPVVQFTPTAQ